MGKAFIPEGNVSELPEAQKTQTVDLRVVTED
jgi:hypothetical protein